MTPPENRAPSLTLDITIQEQNNTLASVRIVGSATDSDGTVVEIVCQGDFSGEFGPTFDQMRDVTKLEGQSRNFSTTCVATDDDGATASAFDGVQIDAAIEPDPIVTSGTGSAVSGLFMLEGGFIVFDSEHSGSSNFIVTLLNEQGDLVELVVNTIGDYEGVRGFSIPPGRYLLDIDADGSWQVVILQPRDDSGIRPPVNIIGDGDAVWGPLQLSSDVFVIASWDHIGESNFIVWLFRSDGAQIELVVNEIGDTSGSTVLSIPSTGIYYMDVHSEGSWTIEVLETF
jgi:hypothetical protein